MAIIIIIIVIHEINILMLKADLTFDVIRTFEDVFKSRVPQNKTA